MISQSPDSLHRAGIVGRSPAAEALRESVRRIAASESNVLLIGEPGTGKRFVAEQIHFASSKKPGTFAEINPASTEEEVKAVLFEENRKRSEGILGRSLPNVGKNATVFVRNIHEFSIMEQTRIARFLIQNEPGSAQKRTNARVIFAVPAPWLTLRKERVIIDSVDMYVRKFDHVLLPPLREHPDDLPDLVHLFIEVGGHKNNPAPALSDSSLQRLVDHSWHENIRELRYLIEDALRISPGEELILPMGFIDEVKAVREMLGKIMLGKKIDMETTLDALEKSLIRRALVRANFDKSRTAGILGLSDVGIRYRLQKHDIHLPPARSRKSAPGTARNSSRRRNSR